MSRDAKMSREQLENTIQTTQSALTTTVVAAAAIPSVKLDQEKMEYTVVIILW
jgi:hypothetical protein